LHTPSVIVVTSNDNKTGSYVYKWVVKRDMTGNAFIYILRVHGEWISLIKLFNQMFKRYFHIIYNGGIAGIKKNLND
jgi:predicted small secreted protein